MTLSLKLIFSVLVLFVVGCCDATNTQPSYKKLHVVSHKRERHHHRHHWHHLIPHFKEHKPRFKPGPWKKARATFYDGGSGTFGGACSYKDVVSLGYGTDTAALSQVLFLEGQSCGACFELKCVDDPKWCKPGSLIVTGTDHCPPNPSLPNDNGGWCNPPNEHFDIAKPAFAQIADYTAGVVPIEYRRVPCNKKGGIRFMITGNPYFYQVQVTNVAGAGDVVSLQVKGSEKLKWTHLERDWGSTWKTSASLLGESLTFRVGSSDGRFSTSWHITPKNWQFGQTYVGKNFR